MKNMKPKRKCLWRGQTGNKFRVYKITNNEGKTMYIQNKAQADRVFNASMRVYRKRSK